MQKMSIEGLMRFIANQQHLAPKVYTCYNRAERDRPPERQPEGQAWRRLSKRVPSVTTFTAGSRRSAWLSGWRLDGRSRAERGHQPSSKGKWRAAARKKAVVAVARQLALDLWRLFTG